MSTNAGSSAMALNPYTRTPYSAKYHQLRRGAQRLPVSQRMSEILSTICQHTVTIIVAQTGSGKTTQIPQHIVLAGSIKPGGSRLVLTQNRRLAADLVAERIAEEMDVSVGQTVGVRHRGCNTVTDVTRLEIVTDGSLVASARSDPMLSGYNVIVIDEAHQHTVPTDMLLALAKKLAQVRPDDLKIVIMSATIDAAAFAAYFPGSALETVAGREHPVTVEYLREMPESPDETIVDTIMHVHLTGEPGDILVFAPGVPEIRKIMNAVGAAISGDGAWFDESEIGPLACWPLHAQLSAADQNAAVVAVRPASRHGHCGRKLVVATNVAETSVTLSGIVHVIDSCRVKSKVWNCKDETWSLRAHWISKAEAAQRAGRAGRTRPGHVYRMVSQRVYDRQFTEHAVPAILAGDMLREYLDAAKMECSPVSFAYFQAPASSTMITAMELHNELGTIDAKGNLTEYGNIVSGLPVHPYAAKALLASAPLRCSDGVLSIVAMIEASDGGMTVFQSPADSAAKKKLANIRRKLRHPLGDHLTLLHIYMSWRAARAAGNAKAFVEEHMLVEGTLKAADQTRQQLLKRLRKVKNWGQQCTKEHDPAKILKALAAGYFLHVAKRPDIKKPKVYETVRRGNQVELESSTHLGPPSPLNEWVIYNEVNDTKDGKKIRLVSCMPPEFLAAMAPLYWGDVEFLPAGHIQDSMASTISRMTGESEADLLASV